MHIAQRSIKRLNYILLCASPKTALNLNKKANVLWLAFKYFTGFY